MTPFPSARTLAHWVAMGALVGVLCGLSSALFLFLLDAVTAFRIGHPRWVYGLPLAGLAVGALYAKWGKAVMTGSNLVLDVAHDGGPQLPLRMAPMVLVGTLVTHLFGGSAGREGTAVQMGANLADAVAHRFRVRPPLRRELVAAGTAGGFGAVFGTPFAGMLFGLEVVVIGRLSYPALIPALVAAFVGDAVTRALGVVHTPYPRVGHLPMDVSVLGKWLLFALAVAAVATAFIELTHLFKKQLARTLPLLPLRMAAGGLAVVVLWQWVGTDDYLGLGVPTILRSFTDAELPWATFALKLLFTAVTLGAGFLGGEVTPLFFIGAALGNVLGRLLGLPLDLAAGVGLAATFAAAANTPLALSVMAVELLGMNVLPHVLLVSTVAFFFTGHRGIYTAQRLARPKPFGRALPAPGPIALRDLPRKR